MPKPVALLREICSVPGTDLPLEFDRDGSANAPDGSRFRAQGGVPILRDEASRPVLTRRSHQSWIVGQDLIEHMCGLPGYTLFLGGGNKGFSHPKVVDVEFDLFDETDVVADGHRLPFRSNSFDLYFAMNVYEHLQRPAVAAAEALRILKPGGEIHIQTAFLQPLHEEPAHYYNATEFGVREWFRDFESVACTVPGNLNPLYALSWLSHELLSASEARLGRDASARLGALTLADLARFWRKPEGWSPEAHALFLALPEEAQRRFAAGFDLRARKPGGA